MGICSKVLSYNTIPSSQVPLAACTCSGRCEYQSVVWGRCEQHDIELGESYGHHWCLQCEMFHCKNHYKKCCEKYGSSIMVRSSNQTLPQIRRRTQQIIKEWEDEVSKYKKWEDQIKTRRFICAECRSPVCNCDMKNFQLYERRKKRRARMLDRLMESRDAELRQMMETRKAELTRMQDELRKMIDS